MGFIAVYFGADVAIVGFNQPFDNGEADTRTAMFSGTRFFATIKTFENKWQILFFNFDPGIGENRSNVSIHRLCKYFECSAGNRIPDGILHQIADNLG